MCGCAGGAGGVWARQSVLGGKWRGGGFVVVSLVFGEGKWREMVRGEDAGSG